MSRYATRSKLLRFSLLAASSAAALTYGSSAHASGYLAARMGSDHGTPAMANAYAIYFNPAAMGGTKGTTITGDLSLLLRHASYTRTADALSPTDPNSTKDPTYVAANTGKASITNVIALPFLGATTDFGTKNFRMGVAAYIPFGGQASWDKTNGAAGAPGSTDGPQRWHNISGIIIAEYNTLAASYTIAPIRLTLGASVSAVFHDVKTVRARTPDDSDDIVGFDGSLKEGRSLLSASGWNVGASVGAYWQDEENRLRLGLAYLSQPGFGTTRMSGELTQQLGNATSANVAKKIDFLQTYPDIVRLGGAYRVPGDKVEVRADFEYVRWSVFDKQCVVNEGAACETNRDTGAATSDPRQIVINIQRNWRDAVGARAGGAYFWNDDLELFGSLGFTTPAVPVGTIDASTIDAFRIYATLGAKYAVSQHVALGGSYNHIFFLNVDTANRSQLDQFQAPSKSPSADGKYSSTVGFLNLNASYTF